MDSTLKAVIRGQFGAAIDMLENAIAACPDRLWGERALRPEFWYTAFHALFYLDFYLSESEHSYIPPVPFTLDELDERGLIPDRVYSKDELTAFLAHGRGKCLTRIAAMTSEDAARRCGFHWLEMSNMELLLYNMRHVQHHAAQLNMLLSQHGRSAPRWVRRTPDGPDAA